jgi:hypothetical protein
MKRILVALVLILAAGTALAQQERRAAEAPILPPTKVVPCPFPYSQTFTAPPPATPTPVVSAFPPALQAAIAGSVWNQTAANKHFGHTFRFPSERQCCLITSGKLEVKIKALQTAPKNGSGSANDAVHAIANGAIFASQQPWLNTGVTAGATTTVTFPLNAQQLAGGTISFYVQDDASVISAKLTVSGCCIRKP